MKTCRPRPLLGLLLLMLPVLALALDTDLDDSWNGDSIAVAIGQQSAAPTFNFPFADLHRTSSGKIVLLTRQMDNDGALMWRLLANGDFDTGFGGGDAITTPEWSGGIFVPERSVLRPDGQIAVVGSTGLRSGVCLIPVAGTGFNGSFGDDSGCATHDFILDLEVGDSESFTDVANLGGNGLLAVGSLNDDQGLITATSLTLMRLDSGGLPVASFDGDGYLTLSWSGLSVLKPRVTRVRNGQVVVAFGGVRYSPSFSQDLYAVRINLADGSVDTGYGDNGLARLHFDGVGGGDASVSVRAAQMLTDGGMVAAVQLKSPGNLDYVGAAKLDSTGHADGAFGYSGGRTWFRFDELYAYERIGGMTVDTSGRMLITVTISDSLTFDNGSELAMARLRPDGTLDETFGDFGRFRMQLDRAGMMGRNADVAISTLYENGRLLLGGLSDGSSTDLEPTIIGFQSSLFRDGLEDPLLQPEP